MNKLKVHIRKGVTEYHELRGDDLKCPGKCTINKCVALKKARCKAENDAFKNLSEEELALFILDLCEKADFIIEDEE